MEKVIIKKCSEYNSSTIAKLISEGIEELGVKPFGKTLVKPNTVIAHKKFYANAYTRPELLDGLFIAIKEHGSKISELQIGERSGLTVPTRYAFEEAGYKEIINRHNIKACYFDEEKDAKIALKQPPARRPYIYVPESIAKAEFFVNVPKFKSHPWTKVTFALKNLIGIQDDKHRIIDHDHKLEYKIADLQQVIKPGLIVIDGIISGQKTMLTPIPFPLGLIIMGTNPVATDSVCSHIINLDPARVDHIRISNERGYGPILLKDIELISDEPLSLIQKRTKEYQLSLDKIDNIFNDGKSNLTVHLGSAPDSYDYCWGGCPGALHEAMQIIEAMQPNVYHEIKPFHLVFGKINQKELNVENGQRVIFIGDCSAFDGKINGSAVKIELMYREKDKNAPEHAKSGDLLIKILSFLSMFILNFRKRVFRIPGCPVTVAENVLMCAFYGKTKNPYLNPGVIIRFTKNYIMMKLMRFYNLTIKPFLTSFFM